MSCEHEWASERQMRLCVKCLKVQITVQVFRKGLAVGEYAVMIPATNEREAAEYWLTHTSNLYQFRFLGENGYVQPSPHYADRLEPK